MNRAGLGRGDIILEVDGTPAIDTRSFWAALADTRLRPGDHTMLLVRRVDSEALQQVDIELGPGLADPESVHQLLSFGLAGLLMLSSAFAVALAPWIIRVHYPLAAIAAAGALHLALVFPTSHPLFGLTVRARPLAAWRNAVLGVNYSGAVLLSISLPLLNEWFYVVLLGWLLCACGLMLGSYRHASSPVARAQLRWVFSAMALVAVAWGLAAVPFVTDWTIIPVPFWASMAIIALFPGAIGIAILRYRLFDIDVIINRTLVYGSVTAVLAGVFAALSIVTQRVVLVVTGQESQAAVVLAALVVTALFQPLRARVQVAVDRRFYRRKYDATRTLERFALHLREEVELDRLAEALVSAVQETMQPAHVSLWLRAAPTNELSRRSSVTIPG